MAKKEKEHTKYYNDRGHEVPSVTTILKLINKPELVNWANWLGFKKWKVDTVLEQSSEIGTNVHNLIEKFIKNKYIELDKPGETKYEGSAELVEHCFNLFYKWHKDHKIKYILSEAQLVCNTYGGTVDCVCEVDGTLFIVDFKTSSKVYSSMFMQLAGYLHLVKMNYPDLKIEKVAILHIGRKNKKYKFVEISKEDLYPYYQAFMDTHDLYFTMRAMNEDWDGR